MSSKCKCNINKIKEHVRGDMKAYKKEYHEDEELMHDLEGRSQKGSKKEHSKKKKDPKPKSPKNKVRVVMDEFKAGELHSGSHEGPIVHNPKQAIAIALSYGKKKRK